MQQQDQATKFRRLHQQPPLVLPNAWDAVSARVIARAGAQAIATTSAGVSWALGRRDGQGLDRRHAMTALRDIVEAVDVPVTADIESGFGAGTAADVAETVTAVLQAGAVGINLEDAPGRDGEPLLTPEQQAERLRAARTVARSQGINLFINARVDVFIAGVGEPEGRLADVVRRAVAYLESGADGIFVPAVSDGETISALIAAISAPLNFMVGPGALEISELTKLGVTRMSLGPNMMLGASSYLERATRQVLTDGCYGGLESSLTYGEVNGLFADD